MVESSNSLYLENNILYSSGKGFFVIVNSLDYENSVLARITIKPLLEDSVIYLEFKTSDPEILSMHIEGNVHVSYKEREIFFCKMKFQFL